MNDTLLVFTQSLSRLCLSGLSLSHSLGEIWSSEHHPKPVKLAALEIRSSLDGGMKLSTALSLCQWISFPEWYIAFMTLAEEGGNVCSTLDFLYSLLDRQKKMTGRFLAALPYPLFICTACLMFGLLLPRWFSSLRVAGSAASGTVESFVFLPTLFLISMALLLLFVLKKLLQVDDLTLLLQSLSFLTSSGISLPRALECSLVIVRKNQKLFYAVDAIRMGLLEGRSASSLFYRELDKAGFSGAAKICALELSLSESGSSDRPFQKACVRLNEKSARKKESLLSLEQPFMLCISALYMVMVLKDSVIPLLFPTNLGI